MNHQYMVEGLKAIGSFFGEDYKPESIKAIQSVILLEPDAAMKQAYSRIVTEFPQRFLPPLAKVKDIIQQEGKKIREQESLEREKKDRLNRQNLPETLPQGHDAYSRACCEFLGKMFSGHYTKAEKRNLAEEGDRQFPGKGFRYWLEGSLGN